MLRTTDNLWINLSCYSLELYISTSEQMLTRVHMVQNEKSTYANALRRAVNQHSVSDSQMLVEREFCCFERLKVLFFFH